MANLLTRVGFARLIVLAAGLVGSVPASAQSPVPVTDDNFLNYMPSLLQRPDHGFVIVYERLDANFENGDLMITFSSTGVSWTTPQVVVAGPGNERHPSLVQQTDGSYLLFYLSDGSGYYQILQASSPDGVVWAELGTVDLGWSATDQLVNPTVCREPDGSLTMSYDKLSDGGYVAHSTAGINWDQDRTRVSDGSLNRIMRHNDGTYLLSYQRRTGLYYWQIDIFTRTSPDRVSWSAENRVTTNQNSHDSFPLELLDATYALYYAKSSGGQPYDLFSREAGDGSSWGGETGWVPYSGWDTQPHPITCHSGAVALAWARGATQNTTQVYFVLFDPPAAAPIDDPAPSDLALTVAPNPASGPVRLRYAAPAVGPAELAVFDLRGRLVRRLAQVFGSGVLTWDGTDRHGRPVASGTYLARLRQGRHLQSQRILVTR